MLDLVNVLAYECSTLPEDTKQIASIVATVINIIKIFVPILLIIWGMLDLGKAVMAQKDDEIKKGQQTFIKRLIAAVIVFFIVVVVQIVVNLIATEDNPMSCVNCFLSQNGVNSCTWRQ